MRKEEWTDEKHRMYLKCMEASFVNQLYGSKQMLAIPTTTTSTSTTTRQVHFNFFLLFQL